MRLYVIRCPNRGEHVRIAWTTEGLEGSSAGDATRSMVCLDAGDACRGPLCHLFQTQPVRMVDRLRSVQTRLVCGACVEPVQEQDD